MPQAITRYRCEVCGLIHRFLDDAYRCEEEGRPDIGAIRAGLVLTICGSDPVGPGAVSCVVDAVVRGHGIEIWQWTVWDVADGAVDSITGLTTVECFGARPFILNSRRDFDHWLETCRRLPVGSLRLARMLAYMRQMKLTPLTWDGSALSVLAW